MPQTSVSQDPAVAYQGQIAEPGATNFARSARAEGASVSAGIPVKRGTHKEKQVEPFEAADIPTAQNFAGVLILDPTRPYSDDAIEDGDPVSVMRDGVVYMTFGGAVSAGQGVAMVMSTGVLSGIDDTAATVAGSYRLPGLRVVETTSGAGLAAVEVMVFGLAGGDGGASEAGAAALVRVSNIPIGPVALASIGTDAASTAGSVYFSELYLPEDKIITGLGVLNGTVVGTDDVIYALYDAAGNLVANTALAGTLSAVADTFQEIAFTAPYAARAGKYWVAFQVEGATAAHQTIAAGTYLNSTGSVAGVFGTLPATITPTTTTTAGVGPIAYAYT